jgi:rod shape-determining protein MreD
MRSLFACSSLALFGFFFNGTLIKQPFPGAIVPDFTVIITVLIAFYFRSVRGLLGAFFLGLAADMMSVRLLGPNAAGCVVVFLAAGLLYSRSMLENPLFLFIVTVFAVVLKYLTSAGIIWLATPDVFAPILVSHQIVLEALITALLAPVVAMFVRYRFNSHPLKQPKKYSRGRVGGSKRAFV